MIVPLRHAPPVAFRTCRAPALACRRGLIMGLLFLSARETLELPHYLNGTVMLMVSVSATLIAVARWRHTAGSVANNTSTRENRGTN